MSLQYFNVFDNAYKWYF